MQGVDLIGVVGPLVLEDAEDFHTKARKISGMPEVVLQPLAAFAN